MLQILTIRDQFDERFFSPLEIENSGVEIASTNFWQTSIGLAGVYHLSFHAGAFRLLVPKESYPFVFDELREISRCSTATIEPSLLFPGALDLVFEDGTSYPFFLCLKKNRTSGVFEAKSHKKRGEKSPLFIYTSGGLFKQMRLRWKL